MTRLFEGRPKRTDGRLTKENPYKEAQGSRAAMNRARTILVEWDAHIAAPGEAKRDATITDLKKRLTRKTQECTLLEKKRKAAHTAIAALFHDNEALRQQLNRGLFESVFVQVAMGAVRPAMASRLVVQGIKAPESAGRGQWFRRIGCSTRLSGTLRGLPPLRRSSWASYRNA